MPWAEKYGQVPGWSFDNEYKVHGIGVGLVSFGLTFTSLAPHGVLQVGQRGHMLDPNN
jgi:hypothetical protein